MNCNRTSLLLILVASMMFLIAIVGCQNVTEFSYQQDLLPPVQRYSGDNAEDIERFLRDFTEMLASDKLEIFYLTKDTVGDEYQGICILVFGSTKNLSIHAGVDQMIRIKEELECELANAGFGMTKGLSYASDVWEKNI